jgi:phosphate transport system substrate-binding protein
MSKRRLAWIFLSLSLVVFPVSCSRKKAGNEIVVAGSTSVQPFADRWAEAFIKGRPGCFVNVQGGGSSAGIQAAMSGAADIGMSSRELKADERDLKETVVARDGLAIIVHRANPLRGLRLTDVKQVFTGEIPTWKYLGGQDKAITVVTREEGSGTRGAFQELVIGKSRISRRAIVEDSNGTVREIVAGDPNAVGYISLGLVDERVRALAIDGVEASEATILEGRYKLVRPFLFVSKGELNGIAKAFVEFVLSPEGRDIIRKEGLLAAQ